MSKTVQMNMWMSIIPNKMFDSWVRKGYIPKLAKNIVEGEEPWINAYVNVLEKGSEQKFEHSNTETKELVKKGWKMLYRRYNVDSPIFKKMKREVDNWYSKVFTHVNAWLKKEGLIVLEKGSFNGGFCATDKEDESTKNWGAPLAKPENKIIQIKEKFGRIVVYTGGLTKEESVKLDKFAKLVEKKFDCCADFS